MWTIISPGVTGGHLGVLPSISEKGGTMTSSYILVKWDTHLSGGIQEDKGCLGSDSLPEISFQKRDGFLSFAASITFLHSSLVCSLLLYCIRCLYSFLCINSFRRASFLTWSPALRYSWYVWFTNCFAALQLWLNQGLDQLYDFWRFLLYECARCGFNCSKRISYISVGFRWIAWLPTGLRASIRFFEVKSCFKFCANLGDHLTRQPTLSNAVISVWYLGCV